MKRYEKYRDSGIEWIGEIPSHWETYRLGVIGNFSSSGIDKKIIDNEPEVKIINYTDVYGNRGFFLDSQKDYMKVTTPQSKIEQHSVKKGDLIFTPSSETIEDIGLSAVIIEELENTAFSYHVLRFQFNRGIDLDFKKYLCNNHYVLNQFSKNAQGTTRKTLGRDDFKNAMIILPPLEEQTAIANYLDQKTAEIDELITDKKRLLELYEEEKTAIINQAVTKGLDPNVPMKDSGIKWLGEIPEHWEVKKVKQFTNVLTGSTPKSAEETYWNGDINWVTTDDLGKLETKEVYESRRKITKKGFKNSGTFIAPVDSIVLSTRAPIGHLGILKVEACTNQGCKTIMVDKKFDSVFLYYYLHSGKSFLNSLGVGTTFVELPTQSLKDFSIPFPTPEEQTAIANYIETECARINTKKTNAEKLIELLTEYRTALISEVVTGKIKVTD